MRIEDYDGVMDLLASVGGVALREADSQASTAAYLLRNPDLSVVAERDSVIVGCAMCGHDGRRGYLQHVAVHPRLGTIGLGTELVRECLARLAAQGIHKVHVFALLDNDAGICYWRRAGWRLRNDIAVFSWSPAGRPNV